MTLKQKAEEFAERNNGILLSYIAGKLGPMTAKIKVGADYYYIFFAREWYHKYDGITIPKDALDSAVNLNAMIVIFVNDEEFWQHSSVWRLGRILENPMFHKVEVLQERQHLKPPGAPFPKSLEGFF